MSSSTTPSARPRPPQVTASAWMIMGGGAIMVLSVYDTISRVRSLETQDAIEAVLTEPPGSGMGLTVSSALRLLELTATISAVCAAAAAVLGFYVLQAHRPARLGLAIIALPLFLSGLATGAFWSSLIAAASVMLWLQPARDWFDGRSPATPSSTPTPTAPPAAQAGGTTPSLPPGAERISAPHPIEPPGPFHGYGDPVAPAPPTLTPPTAPTDPIESTTSAPGTPSPAPPRGPTLAGRHVGEQRRPEAVLVAAVITWVASLLGLITGIAALTLLMQDPGAVLREVTRQDPALANLGVSEDFLIKSLLVTFTLLVVWSVVAVVAATAMLRRQRWAAQTLTGMSAMISAACLLLAVSTPVLVVPALAGAAVFGLLRRRDVRDWI